MQAKQTTRKIIGVHCENCVGKILKTLDAEFGPISFDEGLKYISFYGCAEEFSDALADLGFELAAD